MDLSSRVKTVFRSLQYRNYRLFFGGQSISLIGTWMQRIAMPWLVYHLTGSAFLLGLVSFASQVPTFILAPIAGVVTDKFNRYKVLLVTQMVSFIQALILAILSLTGHLDIWALVILGICLGIINAFDVPSRHSFVIQMVEKKEDLGNAIALNSLMFNGARLIGPSVAGIILATTSEGVCFLINAISFLFVIISLFMMKVPERKIEKKKTDIMKEMKEGFQYTFGFPPIKYLLLLLALVNLLGAYQVLMPVFAKEVLKGGSDTFGFLMGAAGFGALIGALYLASRETVLMLGRLVPAATAIFGAALIVLSFITSFDISISLMVFAGMGLMLMTAASNTILQTITDDDKRGRMLGFYTIAVMGTSPFGSLIAGSLAKIAGTQGAILIGGAGCLLGAILFLRKLPELRKSVRPVYVKMGIIPEMAAGLQTASEPSPEKTDLSS